MKMMKLESQLLKVLFNDQRMIMSDEDRAAFDAATVCHICNKEWNLPEPQRRKQPAPVETLESGDDDTGLDEEEEEVEEQEAAAEAEGQQQVRKCKWEKVRDHDHLTGKFRGAAHNFCNLRYRKQFKIPVLFHNLRNYDGHLIVTAMEKFPKYKITPIAQTLEKYLIIGWGKHIVFKDSLQFMAASLEQLATNLLSKGRQQFRQLNKGFPDETDEKLDMIMRKGIYPYDYMRGWQSLKMRLLPSRQHFKSNLKQSDCSIEDYQRAR
jgi:hypothetical protein